MSFVYVIGRTEDLIAPYDRCYIGVTTDLKRRWSEHKLKTHRVVGKHISEHDLAFEHMEVLFEGTYDECLDKEHELRPIPNMGLNKNPGGKRGVHFLKKEPRS